MKSSIHLNLAMNSSKSVYGFGGDFDYYLNFNWKFGETQSVRRDNMEMVSLYNYEVMKDEG